jgi:hypothetical protein
VYDIGLTITNNDHFFEKRRSISFVKLYESSINDISKLHHTWLENNKEKFFNDPKFYEILREELNTNLL